jgi:MFS family permease
MLGGLGAVCATGPAELLVHSVGWRGLFAILAVASAAVALVILIVVPERKSVHATGSASSIGFSTIFRDPRFWRIAPLAAMGAGVSWSLQGLWAAPWLTDVAGLHRSAVVEHLTLMAATLSAGALLLGALAERLRRSGVSTEMLLAGTLALSMAAQLALVLRLPISSHLLFAIIACAGAATVLSFAVMAQYFPKEASGRANAALGVLNMGAAFGLQCLSGFIVALWPADGGRYPAEAHQAALGLNLVLQAAAFVWFIRPERKAALRHLPAHPIHALATSLGLAPAAALSYARARHAWSSQMARARAQKEAWRSAAFASFAVLALLVSSLGSTILGTSVAAHVIEGAQLTETRDFAGADPQRSKPSIMLDRPAERVPASLAFGPLVRPHAGREPW